MRALATTHAPKKADIYMAQLSFAVNRRKAVLVGPARPTPREMKRLSDIDDQESLRYHVPAMMAYRVSSVRDDDADPVEIIRRALSEALVHYYPLAGRLREVEGRKLVVDCTGEGILFVAAHADVRLAELEAACGGGLRPPFPWMAQLLPDGFGASAVLDCPLVIIQVTRLGCGGFILAHGVNHNICDATGCVQFMNAAADLARGLPAPAAAPAWSREILDAHRLPAPVFQHREYDAEPLPPPLPATPPSDLVSRSFTFFPADIAALKDALQPPLRTTATSFDVLAAFLWRARTTALLIPPNEEVRLVAVVGFKRNIHLPPGFYGNTCAYPTVVMSAGALRSCSLGDVVVLVRGAKASVTAEYVSSMADHLVIRGRPRLCRTNLFVLTDVRYVGFDRVDFGWGRPAYGGPARAQFTVSLLANVNDSGVTGKNIVVVPVSLPRTAMERFAQEMDSFLIV